MTINLYFYRESLFIVHDVKSVEDIEFFLGGKNQGILKEFSPRDWSSYIVKGVGSLELFIFLVLKDGRGKAIEGDKISDVLILLNNVSVYNILFGSEPVLDILLSELQGDLELGPSD